MAEVGCLKDGAFKNLEVKSGNIALNGINIEPWALFGMDSQFLAQNFGAPGNVAGHTTASITCPTTQLVPLVRYVGASDYIKYLQAADGSINLAQAEMLLTDLGDDTNITRIPASGTSLGEWMGTNVVKNVVSITGEITGATGSTVSANDMTAAVGEQCLVLFDNFKWNGSTDALTLNHNAASTYKVAGSTIYVSSTAGSSGMNGLVVSGTSGSAPADGNANTVLTPDTDGTTILHGSFLYFNCADAGGDGEGLHVHGVLLTSGGTVGVSFS